MEDNKWMIVKKEKITTKVKNYLKNIFSKILNTQSKKKKNKIKQEVVYEENIVMPKEPKQVPVKNKELTIEVETKKRPKQLVIEYEKRNTPKKKQIVVEYEKRQKKAQPPKPTPQPKRVQSQQSTPQPKKIQPQQPTPQQRKDIQIEVKKVEKRVIEPKKVEVQPKVKKEKVVETTALKPVKAKKERKPFNIFQLFKDKEKKKRKEILNRLRENKVEEYVTISTKTKLSKGSIAVDDVDANELDPLIDLYRDSNNKLRNRIRESQMR